jgi:hypothetical protein
MEINWRINDFSKKFSEGPLEGPQFALTNLEGHRISLQPGITIFENGIYHIKLNMNGWYEQVPINLRVKLWFENHYGKKSERQRRFTYGYSD